MRHPFLTLVWATSFATGQVENVVTCPIGQVEKKVIVLHLPYKVASKLSDLTGLFVTVGYGIVTFTFSTWL